MKVYHRYNCGRFFCRCAVALIALVALVALMAASGLRADSIQDRLQYLIGTSIEVSGTQTAFLQWQTDNAALLRNQKYSVFVKSGAADSAAAYAQVGRIQPLTGIDEIEAALGRAQIFENEREMLDSSVNLMFSKIMPTAGVRLEEKVATLVFASQDDAAIYAELQFLARRFPSLGVCLGTTFVGGLPGNAAATYEVRLPSGLVMGRVSVDPRNPIYLPAPSEPVQIEITPEVNEDGKRLNVENVIAKGHLNIHMRWGTPELLQLRGMFLFGYNVYRVPEGIADKRGLPNNPPLPGGWNTLIEEGVAVKVNRLPILPPEELSPDAAADTQTDPHTFFTFDDGDRFKQDGVTFNDGEGFYYFVTGADVLGRDGVSSNGTLMTAYDRMGPEPPQNVKVRNTYDHESKDQRLTIDWQLPANGETPAEYAIYRWRTMDEMHQSTRHPEGQVIEGNLVGAPVGRVRAVVGQKDYAFTDSARQDSPRMPDDAGSTFWYTVRAIDGATFANFSGQSAPVFGVLRDRVGPQGGGGYPVGTIWDPTLEVKLSTKVAANDFPPGFEDRLAAPPEIDPNSSDILRIAVVCTRVNDDVASASFQLSTSEGPAIVSEVIKFNDDDLAGTWLLVPDNLTDEVFGTLTCRIDTPGRSESESTQIELGASTAGDYVFVHFEAEVVSGTDLVYGPDQSRKVEHQVFNENGAINPIHIHLQLPEDAREYKIYRRVGQGKQTMVQQGTVAEDQDLEDFSNTPAHSDRRIPPQNAVICYFVQFFDEHGNPGSMQYIGCVHTDASESLPVPVLENPIYAREGGELAVTLQWFCSSHNVRHFRVAIAEDGKQFPRVTNVETALDPESFNSVDDVHYRFFNIPVAGNVGEQSGVFSTKFFIRPNTRYRAYIQSAVSGTKEGGGDPSNGVEILSSGIIVEAGPEVPWPALDLPSAVEETQITPAFIDSEFFLGAAVQIGRFKVHPDDTKDLRLGGVVRVAGQPARRESTVVPLAGGLEPYLYHAVNVSKGIEAAANGEHALPCVLYRAELRDNGTQGNLVQVSPLIERIRARLIGGGQVPPLNTNTTPLAKAGTALLDPFVDVYADQATDTIDDDYGIYIKDTHGVVRGATYRYYLVRFSELFELDLVIDAGTIQIPESDA